MKPAPAVAAPASAVPAQMGGNIYACWASTKDTMQERFKVQAPNEDAAKQTVLQHLGARSYGLATIACSKM